MVEARGRERYGEEIYKAPGAVGAERVGATKGIWGRRMERWVCSSEDRREAAEIGAAVGEEGRAG